MLRSRKQTTENIPPVEDGSKMDTEFPVAPTTRSRRPLGEITNFVTSDRPGDVKKPSFALSSAPPPLPEPSVAESLQSLSSEIAEDDSRAYMRREADNIDIRDVDNPLLCTEVVNEMYENFRRIELEIRVDGNYMNNQPHVNDKMRTILIDWLIEVHLKFKMVPETLYLTVNIIDRFLVLKQVRRSKLQLLGVAALLVASKYEEIYPPEIRDLVYITDRAYNKHEILEMETQILTTLKYNVTVPTVHSFLCRYLKAAHADRTMVQLSCYLAERSLQEFKMVRFLPSVIAAASVLVARKSLNRHPWSPTLVKYTGYDEIDLAECIHTMKDYMNEADAPVAPGTAVQEAAKKKYSSPKFGTVSRTPLMY